MRKIYAAFILASGAVGCVGAFWSPYFLFSVTVSAIACTFLIWQTEKAKSQDLEAMKSDLKAQAEIPLTVLRKRIESLEAKTGFSHVRSPLG
jgi:hypothetical protein